MIPNAAITQYRLSQRLQSLAQLRARRVWSLVRVGMLSESWEDVSESADLVEVVSELQVENAKAGASYSAQSLASQNTYSIPRSFVNPQAFGGHAPDGRSLDGLLYSAVPHTKRLIGGGMDPAAAKASGGRFLDLLVKTAVADAGRAAAGVDIAARPEIGYVRMLNPPSCSRCSLLAGGFYRWNAGFQRHPGCDCIHVPSKGADAAQSEGLIHDPYEYFEGLSEAEQDRLYTKAGAQAIRDGGDIFQVVNSRRGMKPGGLVTTEGTSKRGNYGRGKAPRLTPEGIYSQGKSREETLRLLEKNGYLLPGGQNPNGVIRGSGAGFSRGEAITAAERRGRDARLRWEAVQQGRNPGGGKLTPEVAARVEREFRKTILDY